MNIKKEFWAKAGSVIMPDGVTMLFWGFAPAPDAAPQLPGPTIEAKVGDNILITLHNTLAEPVSMIFPGQDIIPEPVKDEKNTYVSYTLHAPPNGGKVTYSFRAVRPGTYLYESGSFPEKQVQMGLYGVLIIRPHDYQTVGSKTAYGIGSGTEYDIEKIIVTGELDSALHGKIAAGLSYDMLDFAPDYFTINGRAYPDTLNPDNGSSQPYGASIKATTGKRVLLRCANAGFLTHSLHFSGGYFRVVAGDGTPLKTPSLDATYQKTTITIGSGQIYDLILVADIPGEVYLYDRELRCTVNGDRYPGGIMTLIEVAASPPAAPGSLTAIAVLATKVRLNWTDNSGGESNFRIERMKGLTGVFTEIATVSAGITSYEDNNVMENTTYSYRISAYNEYGSSGYSNTAAVTTPASPPLAPSNLVAHRVSYFQIILTWTDNSNTETIFIIERRSQNEPDFIEIGIMPPNFNLFIDNIIYTGITHYYRVRAQNSGGSSPYSNIASAK